MNLSILKQPSAFVPLVMSAAALALTLAALAYYGLPDPASPPHDEGALARIWQLLIALQLPVGMYFAARWLPLRPTDALVVLGLQFAAGLAAVIPVVYLEM